METVAPLAGSVDRNLPTAKQTARAWVAPLAGSVDRNLTVYCATYCAFSRSPRGERG